MVAKLLTAISYRLTVHVIYNSDLTNCAVSTYASVVYVRLTHTSKTLGAARSFLFDHLLQSDWYSFRYDCPVLF